MIGEILGGTYQVERRIGGGGMGVVYEVMQLRISRRFAVKVLTHEMAANPEAMARFRQEAMVTGMLGNPHIVQVLDFNHTEDGTPYIIMELLEGEDLARRLRREKRLPLGRVAAIFKQVCSALYCAHEQGIVHRDLKPANIFICKHEEVDDYVKVVDFGISKVLGVVETVTRPDVVMGSPSYMSPEQAMARSPEIEQTSDIFSMGSILYLMLTGRAPFRADSTPGVIYQIVHDNPPPMRPLRPEIPEALEGVIGRALSKQPALRYQDMVAFWRAYAEAIGADPGELKVTGVSVDEQSTLICADSMMIMESSPDTEEISSFAEEVSDVTPVVDPLPPPGAPEHSDLAAASVMETAALPLDAAIKTSDLSKASTAALDPPEVSTVALDPPEVSTVALDPLEVSTMALDPPQATTLSALSGQMPVPPAARGFSGTQVLLLVVLTLTLGVSITLTLANSNWFSDKSSADKELASTVNAPDPKTVAASSLPAAVESTTKPEPVASPIEEPPPPEAALIPGPAPAKASPRKAPAKATPLRSEPKVARPSRSAPPLAKPPQPKSAAPLKPATLRVVTLGPAGTVTSEIFLDGKLVGRSPIFLKSLRPGVHKVAAHGSGFKRDTRQITLSPGKNKLVFKLNHL